MKQPNLLLEVNKKLVLHTKIISLIYALFIVLTLIASSIKIYFVKIKDDFFCGYDWSNYNICEKNIVFFTNYLYVTSIITNLVIFFYFNKTKELKKYKYYIPLISMLLWFFLVHVLVVFFKIPVLESPNAFGLYFYTVNYYGFPFSVAFFSNSIYFFLGLYVYCILIFLIFVISILYSIVKKLIKKK